MKEATMSNVSEIELVQNDLKEARFFARTAATPALARACAEHAGRIEFDLNALKAASTRK
jgi:hypothetical protein